MRVWSGWRRSGGLALVLACRRAECGKSSWSLWFWCCRKNTAVVEALKCACGFEPVKLSQCRESKKCMFDRRRSLKENETFETANMVRHHSQAHLHHLHRNVTIPLCCMPPTQPQPIAQLVDDQAGPATPVRSAWGREWRDVNRECRAVLTKQSNTPTCGQE